MRYRIKPVETTGEMLPAAHARRGAMRLTRTTGERWHEDASRGAQAPQPLGRDVQDRGGQGGPVQGQHAACQIGHVWLGFTVPYSEGGFCGGVTFRG